MERNFLKPVTDCRFSQTETAAFNAMWDSDQFCGKQLEALVDASLEAFGSPSLIDQSAIKTFSGALEQQKGTLRRLGTNSWLIIGHTSNPCVLRFRKVVTEHFFRFIFGLQSLVVEGLVQLRSDELLSDIDAAIDLHSGEAKDWSTSSTSLMVCGFGRMVPLDPTIASDKVVLTDLCLKWLASWQQWRVVRLVAGRCLALAENFE